MTKREIKDKFLRECTYTMRITDGDEVTILPTQFKRTPEEVASWLGENIDKLLPSEEEIKKILTAYEKTWDSDKGVFLPLNVFQKSKVNGASEAITSLIKEP